MKEILLKAYDFNLAYAKALVDDVEESKMALPGPAGLENHPAFTLGHLCIAAAMTSRYLGGAHDVPDGWDELFRRKGPGDERMPDNDVSQYPSKDALISELKKQHDQVIEQIKGKTTEYWEGSSEWRFQDALPTLGDLTYFMCITHENMHLGQLPAWRRHFGYPSALATLYPK